jgi:hypothetical protein
MHVPEPQTPLSSIALDKPGTTPPAHDGHQLAPEDAWRHQITLSTALLGKAISLEHKLPCDFPRLVWRHMALRNAALLLKRHWSIADHQLRRALTFCLSSLSPSSPSLARFDTLVSTRSVRVTCGC